MAVSEADLIYERLEERDNKIMAMSIEEILRIFKHNTQKLQQILELREAIIKHRSQCG